MSDDEELGAMSSIYYQHCTMPHEAEPRMSELDYELGSLRVGAHYELHRHVDNGSPGSMCSSRSTSSSPGSVFSSGQASSSSSSSGYGSSPPLLHRSTPPPPPPPASSQLYGLLKTGKYNSSDAWASKLSQQRSSDQPMDLSHKPRRNRRPEPYPTTKPCSTGNNSLLQRILTGTRHTHGLTCKTTPCPGSPDLERPVKLAKKTFHPVSAKVTGLLHALRSFLARLPTFGDLSSEVQRRLVVGAWGKLLLLSMAEESLEFAMSEETTAAPSITPISPSSHQVTAREAEQIQSCVARLQQFALDESEYDFLRLITLLSSGASEVRAQEGEVEVEGLCACARQALGEYLRLQLGEYAGAARYCRLLLLLPSLCSVQTRALRNLLCSSEKAGVQLQLLLSNH